MMRVFKELPDHEKRITLSTVLTILRIVLVPCIVFALMGEHWGAAFGLFIFAAATDSIDGALARWRKEQTQLGALLDPVADKILLFSSFFTLAFIKTPLFSIPWWFVAIVALRELIIITGTLVCYNRTKEWRIRPTPLGKMATAVQIGFIVWLFLCYFFAWLPVKTYKGMLCFIVGVELVSLIQYMMIGMQWFAGSSKQGQ